MTTGKVDDELARRNTNSATVFVCDPSAEAERVESALRAAGYTVVDVPLSMLLARVAVQSPRVILIDADSEGSIDAIARVRRLPGCEHVHALFLGREAGALAKDSDAIAREGSGFATRPIEIDSLLAKVNALTGGNPPDRRRRSTTPPPSMASVGNARSLAGASLPPASMRMAEQVAPRIAPTAASAPSLESLIGSDHNRPLVSAALSAELEHLLAEAEQRLPGQLATEALLSPEEEIEAVLPAELLGLLDEPLDSDDDDDGVDPLGSRAMVSSGPRAPVTNSPRRRPSSVRPAAHNLASEPAPPIDRGSTPPPAHTHAAGTQVGSGSRAPATQHGDAISLATAFRSERGDAKPVSPSVEPAPSTVLAEASNLPPPREERSERKEEPDVVVPISPPNRPPSGRPIAEGVLVQADAVGTLARAIAARTTGVLVFDVQGVTRRIVLRDGDLVTVITSTEAESLVAFLVETGELPRETLSRFEGKMANTGRHAGAALVAHGYLRQDQLWPILRGHAEWIVGHVLESRPSIAFDSDAGRLRSEPGVFGGSTGAEVFVEVVRRTFASAVAIEELGGRATKMTLGPGRSMLFECALAAGELEVIENGDGKSIEELIAVAGDEAIASVVYALSLLGIAELVRAVQPAPSVAEERDYDPLDDEAVRGRIRARHALVDEGDYFAILGVGRNATAYEIRRAFLELRRAFEPTRILTPATIDMADDVKRITLVLEEAYEILRDSARRERYRRAIDIPTW